MKKAFSILMVLAFVAAAGCAKKTASEQLQDDMNKAQKSMKKELDSLK